METIREIDDFLKFIGQRVNENAESVRTNSSTLRKMSETDIYHTGRTEIYDKNSRIFSENSELLNIQKMVMSYLNKFRTEINSIKDSREFEEVIQISREELMNKTMEGEITIDENNPCFFDRELLDELYDLCLKSEKYEMCETIKSRMKDLEECDILVHVPQLGENSTDLEDKF